MLTCASLAAAGKVWPCKQNSSFILAHFITKIFFKCKRVVDMLVETLLWMEFNFGFFITALNKESVKHPIFICKNAVKCIYLMYKNIDIVFCMEMFFKYELKIALTFLCPAVHWAIILLIKAAAWPSVASSGRTLAPTKKKTDEWRSRVRGWTLPFRMRPHDVAVSSQNSPNDTDVTWPKAAPCATWQTLE